MINLGQVIKWVICCMRSIYNTSLCFAFSIIKQLELLFYGVFSAAILDVLNHFLRSHFWPFQIDRPFWMSEIHFWSHFWPFQIDTELLLAAILDGNTMSIIELVRYIWTSNACVKFEERCLNPSKVIVLTTKLCGGGGCGADKKRIFPKTCVSREYNYTLDLAHLQRS